MKQAEKIILGVAGQLLSGKTTAAQFFIERYNAKHYKFSRVIDQLLTMLGLPLTRKNEQDMGALMKDLYGDAVWAHALAVNALRNGHRFLFFDGLRKVAEVEALRNELPGFRLIYIEAPIQVRYARLKQRDEKPGENMISFEEFQANELHAADIDIVHLRDHADHIVNNDGSLESFLQQLGHVASGELMR